MQALHHPNANVRKNAVTVLGQLGQEATIPNLVQLLDDPDAQVRGSVIDALGKIGVAISAA
ncbi:MAG: HEAT repeat domain-containing protein [Elainella sp. C42_A2020_010]|nr:HEAT repeat domain-containing protein [Elainella sp. C42_A2020_010]